MTRLVKSTSSMRWSVSTRIVSPCIVRPATDADATSSTGLSRTVTVELLLMGSSPAGRSGRLPNAQRDRRAHVAPVSATCRKPTGYVTQTVRQRQLRQCDILAFTNDARPGGHAKWVRSPHGPATVSG